LKAYLGDIILFHAFLIWVLNVLERSASRTGRFSSGKMTPVLTE